MSSKGLVTSGRAAPPSRARSQMSACCEGDVRRTPASTPSGDAASGNECLPAPSAKTRVAGCMPSASRFQISRRRPSARREVDGPAIGRPYRRRVDAAMRQPRRPALAHVGHPDIRAPTFEVDAGDSRTVRRERRPRAGFGFRPAAACSPAVVSQTRPPATVEAAGCGATAQRDRSIVCDARRARVLAPCRCQSRTRSRRAGELDSRWRRT